MQYYFTEYPSPMGMLKLISDGDSLTGLEFEKQRYFFDENDLIYNDKIDIFYKTKEWLDRYFKGKAPSPHELNLKPIGSTFREIIWELLCEIPYGEVVTYGYIAKKVAEIMKKEKMSAQAVGGAVGHNPISIVIPCHRVVGSGGSLTGYGGGIDRKISLLEFEGIDMNKFYIPSKGTALYI